MAENQNKQNQSSGTAVAEPNVDQKNELVAASDEARRVAISTIIQNSCLISAGVGILPIPFFNLIGTTGTQAAMMHKIAEQYGKSFTSNIIYNIISSVGGGLISTFTTTAISRATLAIPYVGIPIAIATRPAFNALVTYVLGNAFNSYLRDCQDSTSNISATVQKAAEGIATRLLSVGSPAAGTPAAQ